MKTFALDENWDVFCNEVGNIALKDGNDRLVQDVSSSVRVFKGELPFDLERGVDYTDVDNNRDSLNYEMNEQVQLVEGVDDSLVVFNSIENRTLSAQIFVTNADGEQIVVGEQVV